MPLRDRVENLDYVLPGQRCVAAWRVLWTKSNLIHDIKMFTVDPHTENSSNIV